MKHTKIYKHHYNYQEFDTNITEYVSMIVEINRLQKEQVSIISTYRSYLNNLECTTTLDNMYDVLLQEYSESDIKSSYYQLRDLLRDHNAKFRTEQFVSHQIDKKLIEGRIADKHSLETMVHMVDEFGVCRFENDGKQYCITNARVKIRKEKNENSR